MRFIGADLLDQVVSSYDQTKTTVQGRCAVKTIGGDDAVGPPLNRFVDVQTDAALTPVANFLYVTPNNRIFIGSAETGGLSQIALYTINATTGVTTYIGKIQFNLPDTAATTTTFRSIKVIDTGTTGWKIYVTTTGSVAINGGPMLINKVDLADFVPIGFPTIPFATGNDQKAVYFNQDPANTGVNHLNTAAAGSVMDFTNNRLYVHNGVSATHQYYIFDTSLAPQYTSTAVSVSVASPGVVSYTAHPFLANDPVVFTAGTLPTGLTVGTVYFVRNPAANTFELSATSGGASINTTGSPSVGASIGRAFGTSHTQFLHKTGNLPALTGTLLLTDSEYFAQPQHTTNSGFDCAFFATTSQLYLGRLSELTAATTTWPSLVTANLLGTANQIITPTATNAVWSNDLDKAIYATGGAVFVMKQVVNNVIDKIFGGNNNKYQEGVISDVVEFQASAIAGTATRNGFFAMSNITAGQRGIYITDLKSNADFDYSYLVTKVLTLEADVLKFITTIDKLYDFTGSLAVYYRTSGFGTITGGWTALPFAEDLTAFAAGSQIQFKILYDTLGLDTCIPAQLVDFYLGYDGANDTSDNWEYSQDDSSSGNPTDVVYRLKKAYPTSVPTLRFLARDLTNSVVTDHDSVTNIARFSYSTDSGASYTAFGTPPNTVGTLVRYRYSTPPGVDIRPSLREE